MFVQGNFYYPTKHCDLSLRTGHWTECILCNATVVGSTKASVGPMVRVLVIFSPERVVLMVMLAIESDTSTVVPFRNTLFQVNWGVGSPVAVQLRTAGAGERTSTSMGSPSTVTETMEKEFSYYKTFTTISAYNFHSHHSTSNFEKG